MINEFIKENIYNKDLIEMCYRKYNIPKSTIIRKIGQFKNQGSHTTWAKNVKRMSDYRCEKCNSIEDIEAHHIESLSNNKDLEFDIDNGMCLCHKCHRELHGWTKEKISHTDTMEWFYKPM